MNLKRSDWAVFVLLVIALWTRHQNGGIVSPSGPVSKVVVFYESSVGGMEGVQVASVIGGPTSKSLTAADKWRLFDKDAVPDEYRPLFDAAKSLPWCAVLHGKKTTFQGPLPVPEAAFASMIAKQGGV